MKERDNDQLNIFIAKHLENIRKRIDNPAKELGVLKRVASKEELSANEVISVANAGEEALLLRNITSLREKGPSPTGVDEIHQASSQLVVEAVNKRAIELEEAGITPDPAEEITPENMESFLNNTSNYLYGCVSSAFNALSNTTEGILKARANPSKATMFETLCNVVIDQSFKGMVGLENTASLATRAVYGAVGVYGSAGVNATIGTKPKDTTAPVNQAVKAFAKSHDENVLVSLAKATGAAVSSAAVSKALNFKSDIPDIMAHGVVSLLEGGSISDAVYSASTRATYKNLWKVSGGKAHLNRMNFMEAGSQYLNAKHFAKGAMKYISQAGGEISDALIKEYTGIDGQTAKLAVGTAGLAILMGVNSYICQDKVKSSNPKVVSAVQKELSSNIQDIEIQQQEERLKIAQMSAKLIAKEASEQLSNRKTSQTTRKRKYNIHSQHRTMQ